MSITVQSDHLAAALKHGVAASNSPHAPLQHARLRVQGDRLHVDTTDLEVWVSARVPAEQIDVGDFDVLLRDSLLRPVATPGAGEIRIARDGQIRTKRGKYKVPALPPEESLEVDDVEWTPVDVDAAILAGAIAAAGYTASEADTRPICKAVNVVPGGRVWSTDGVQIGQMQVDYNGPRMAIPPRQVQRVLDAMEQEGATVSVANVHEDCARMLRIDGPQLQVSLRLMDGMMTLDMGQHLERHVLGEGAVTLPVADLLAACRRFLPFVQHNSLAAKKKMGFMDLRRVGDAIALYTPDDAFTEQVTDGLEADPAGDWSITVDPKRVMAALNAIGSGSAVIHPRGAAPSGRVLIIVPAGVTFDQAAHILAPMTW